MLQADAGSYLSDVDQWCKMGEEASVYGSQGPDRFSSPRSCIQCASDSAQECLPGKLARSEGGGACTAS